MVTNVVSAQPGDSLLEVADILFSNRFHGLPVLENGKIVGIITEDDFFLKNFDDLFLPSFIKFIKEKKIADNVPEEIKEKMQKLLNAKVKDIMTTTCLTVTSDMDVSELMETIRKTMFATFPVTDQDNNLTGIVTLADILGTVKHGSKAMKRKLEKSGKASDLNNLAADLSAALDDNLVIMSRKRVQTWKGIVLISVIAMLGVILLIVVNANSKNTCGLEDKSVYPLTCQKFVYSNWSACASGAQTRAVLEKSPRNCEGGAPMLEQSCSN